MAVTIYEQVAESTRALEAGIYGALDAIDDYTATIERLLSEQAASAAPNEKLVKRFRQFLARADAMTTYLEDDVITELLFCVDRVFSVELTEKGEFI